MSVDVVPAGLIHQGSRTVPAEVGGWALKQIAAGMWLSADGRDAPQNVRALAAEHGRPAAVVDAPGPDARTDLLIGELFPALASAGNVRVRLVLPRASDRYAAAARRHGLDLVAPAADVSLGEFGCVCHSPAGAAPWLRFSGDAATEWLGSVYPAPRWEARLADAELSVIADEFRVEHVAAGLCLYRPGATDRALVLTARSVVPDVARVTIVAGADASASEVRREIENLIGQLPAATAASLRLVLADAGRGGNDSYAQFLADTFGIHVVAPAGRWTATPDGRLRALPTTAAGLEVGAGTLADGWGEFASRERVAPPERAALDLPDKPAVPDEPAVRDKPPAQLGAPAAVAKIMLYARDHRSSDQERMRYRESAPRYQSFAVSVRRVLTQRPGLRAAAAGDSMDAVVTDFAAVLDFLGDLGGGATAVLRTGTGNDPRITCVVSGLRRLPSFTGVVFSSARRLLDTASAYVTGAVLIEPAFVYATSSGRVALDGGIQYVIWSQTGKRVAALAADAGSDEIVFPAGTAYKVLQVVATSGSSQAQVYLRESSRPSGAIVAVAGSEQDGRAPVRVFEPLDEMDHRVLDRLVTAATIRDEAAADLLSRRAGGSMPPIGIDHLGAPFSLAV